MSRKTLTLIIALTCAVVLALGCFAVQALTAGDKQKTDAPVNFPIQPMLKRPITAHAFSLMIPNS